MPIEIANLVERIRALETELEAELARRRAELRVGMERGRVVFEREVLRRHREMKTTLWRYLARGRPFAVLTAPVIYAGIVPLALLDLFVSLYQAICFPAYGLEKARRADYMIFDRRFLGYLNAVEKLNCAYCSYANGVIAYAREVGARTEKHWCPIKHARRAIGTHDLYKEFADFGDAEAYRQLSARREPGAGAP